MLETAGRQARQEAFRRVLGGSLVCLLDSDGLCGVSMGLLARQTGCPCCRATPGALGEFELQFKFSRASRNRLLRQARALSDGDPGEKSFRGGLTILRGTAILPVGTATVARISIRSHNSWHGFPSGLIGAERVPLCDLVARNTA